MGYVSANILQAMTLNRLMPSGFRLIAEDEIGKPLFTDFSLPKEPLFSVDVTIPGERATSRQIAIKEREALRRSQSQV